MGFNIGEILNGVNLEEVPEENLELHRNKKELKRPTEEVELKSLYTDKYEVKKTQKDPTEDLIVVPAGLNEIDFSKFMMDIDKMHGYLIYDTNTLITYLAPTKGCLDANFIYREDLIIKEYDRIANAWSYYSEKGALVNPGIIPRQTCYILDNPANETYEVYYDSALPSRVYGKATPQGCFIHKYPNRFHRDMAILELDSIYSDTSKKEAGKMTKKKIGQNEAIVISDGAWMKEVSTSSIVYLDSERVLKCTEGRIPSEPDQAVLISEIKGATMALEFCKAFGKKKITYYYDNTSIVNVFRNRKTEYIEEIAEYKRLLESLQALGYQVNFVELHPKTGEDRDTENKALMFFHNGCDAECRSMSEIFKRDYRSYAADGSTDGKTYSKIKEEFKPKGKPKQGGNLNYKKPGNSFKR